LACNPGMMKELFIAKHRLIKDLDISIFDLIQKEKQHSIVWFGLKFRNICWNC
jgi:hypothetical protein